MQIIVLEKEWFIMKIVSAIDEIDTFLCTNGFKALISAEGSVIESCRLGRGRFFLDEKSGLEKEARVTWNFPGG